MQEKLNGYLEAMKAEREQVLNKDINAIVEEKVNAYREKVFAEAQAEVRAEVAVYDIRIDTVEGIIKELATEATTIE